MRSRNEDDRKANSRCITGTRSESDAWGSLTIYVRFVLHAPTQESGELHRFFPLNVIFKKGTKLTRINIYPGLFYPGFAVTQ